MFLLSFLFLLFPLSYILSYFLSHVFRSVSLPSSVFQISFIFCYSPFTLHLSVFLFLYLYLSLSLLLFPFSFSLSLPFPTISLISFLLSLYPSLRQPSFSPSSPFLTSLLSLRPSPHLVFPLSFSPISPSYSPSLPSLPPPLLSPIPRPYAYVKPSPSICSPPSSSVYLTSVQPNDTAAPSVQRGLKGRSEYRTAGISLVPRPGCTGTSLSFLPETRRHCVKFIPFDINKCTLRVAGVFSWFHLMH